MSIVLQWYLNVLCLQANSQGTNLNTFLLRLQRSAEPALEEYQLDYQHDPLDILTKLMARNLLPPILK